MRRSPMLLACTLALSLTGGGVRAQDLSVPPPPPAGAGAFPAPPPPPLLAQALAALPPPRQDLFLTVGADRVSLPPDAAPPDPDSRPGQVGAAYGRLARDFGGVMALAPPTMVVLNPRPGVPDPYDGMPADEAFKLLLAGLNPLQWDALTSENGLGAGDLSDEGQRALFREVLPAGDLAAFPEYSPFIPSPSSEVVTLAARDVGAARLRLGRRMQVGIPAAGPTKTSAGYRAPLAPGVTGYEANSVPNDPHDTRYGAVLRQTLLNSPKEADLDYDAPALKGSLRVDGIATVGDLVARVGQAAGLELYADRRYETRRVTLLGRRTARGVDLLRAVAFCVTGTYRKVGPAYVLTDDREGTSPRRQRLTRFVRQAEMMRHAAVEAAGDSLATAHGGEGALPWLGGLGFSDAQQALPGFNRSAGGDVTVPFALLTPAQQEFALGRAGQVASSGDTRLDMSGAFPLQARTHLLLLSPAAPGPFLLDYLSLYQMFRPSFKSQVEADRRRAAEAAKMNPLPMMLSFARPAAPASALAPFPRRAVLAAPRTAAEVDSVVASMKALGLNQLWLDVFSGGRSHLDTPREKSEGGGPDFLTAALARTKGTGIAVIPALDLLRWDEDAASEALDRTALGETSAQQEAWYRRYASATTDLPVKPAVPPPPAALWASPAAPGVEGTLLALVRRLAATPGVTTVALRDTVPPGYEHPPGSRYGISEADLGYVPALRLALLRRDHMDPIDLDGGYDSDTSLPEFDDIHSSEHTQALAQATQDWNALRDGASRDLLRRLLAAAREAGGRVRFLLSQRGHAGMGGWYGLWDDPQAPLPEVPEAGMFDPLRPPGEINYAPVAHSQSRIALYALPAWATRSPYITADMLRKLRPGWDGVVLDATVPVLGMSGGDSLAALARGADPHAPKPAP